MDRDKMNVVSGGSVRHTRHCLRHSSPLFEIRHTASTAKEEEEDAAAAASVYPSNAISFCVDLGLGFSGPFSAETMLEGKAVLGEADMSVRMQQHAMRCASRALDLYDVENHREIARFIKQEFDRNYGSGWQCVVGTSFGSFVTHSQGSFIYFSLGKLLFMLFKLSNCSCCAA